MSEFKQGDAYQVIWLVRRLFRSLARERLEHRLGALQGGCQHIDFFGGVVQPE
jgi:hypothetical protein